MFRPGSAVLRLLPTLRRVESVWARNGWVRRVCLVFVSAGAGAWAYLRWKQQPVTVDDAFISYRYADMLVRGEGLVYNAGERVEGYSNFLWVLIAALAISLGLDPLLVTRSI